MKRNGSKEQQPTLNPSQLGKRSEPNSLGSPRRQIRTSVAVAMFDAAKD